MVSVGTIRSGRCAHTEISRSVGMMRKMHWMIIFLIAAVVFLTGCKDQEVPITGGAIQETNYEAPKKIESTEITSFNCEFSLTAVEGELEFPLQYGMYYLTAELKDNKALCEYRIVTADNEIEEFSFETGKEFMDELQMIVSENDLAQHNGTDVFVVGIADMYGSYLNIKYASDEYIYARHNTVVFLSMNVMKEFVELFEKERT